MKRYLGPFQAFREYQQWEDWISNENEIAPQTASNGFQTCETWKTMFAFDIFFFSRLKENEVFWLYGLSCLCHLSRFMQITVVNGIVSLQKNARRLCGGALCKKILPFHLIFVIAGLRSGDDHTHCFWHGPRLHVQPLHCAVASGDCDMHCRHHPGHFPRAWLGTRCVSSSKSKK